MLLFETYMPLSSVAARTTAIWLQFLPITVGALVLLQLVQFPLAARLARQTGRARRDRELMLHRSLAASDAERRRIAADLHDGVVQDLAATSIALAGAAVAARRRPEHGDESGRLHLAADAVRAASGRCARWSSTSTRPTCAARAWPPRSATSPRRRRRAASTATLVVDDGAARGLGGPAEQFAFRVAQEALRNAVAHAGASAVELRLARTGGERGRRPALAQRDRRRRGLRPGGRRPRTTGRGWACGCWTTSPATSAGGST